MKSFTREELNFADRKTRAKFIAENPNEGFSGRNDKGELVYVGVGKDGEGMVVKTQHPEKPNWWECVEYDKDGLQVSVSYER